MLLFIDNYDSFTYNLVAYCKELGAHTKVIANDELSLEEVKQLKPSKILISPGPGSPKDSGISMDVIKEFHQSTPILGVCLGHQCLVEYFGGDVVLAPRQMHGKTSIVIHDDSQLFTHIQNNFRVARYHSLIADNNLFINDELIVTAYSEYNNAKEIMAIQHKKHRLYGVQFHPEALMSEYGHQLLHNFLTL